MSEQAHAELGASKADRWMNCPGSITLSRDLPELTTEYALDGRAAHELAQAALKKKVDCHVFEGMFLEGREVTIEMIEAVQVYVDHVRKIIKKSEPGSEHWIEVKFDLAPLNPPAPMFGRGDFVNWQPSARILDVVDYKHGVGVVVDVFENVQLMYYVLGAVLELGKKPSTLRITIVQPRGAHPDGIIRVYEFHWKDLVEFKKKLFERARIALDPKAERKVGEWCRFCPALAICPDQHTNAVVLAQSEFEVMATEDELPEPERLTQEHLLLVMDKMGIVENWFGAVRAYVQGQLERGEEVPGWKLVPKRATRKWADDEAVLKYLSAQGIDEEEQYTRKLLSPAQAEKALRALAPRGKKKDVTLPEELVTTTSPGHTLAPDLDPRKAITYVAGEEFFE